jgi:hypothetical protein
MKNWELNHIFVNPITPLGEKEYRKQERDTTEVFSEKADWASTMPTGNR